MNPFLQCDNLESIDVSPDHSYLETIDGVLFNKPDKKLICYPCSFTEETYVIPDGVLEIGAQAFSSCSGLTGITIPDSVIGIGSFAFSSCSALINITIPDSVIIIGARAFDSCSSLTSITIPDSVTRIGETAFNNCSKLNATVSRDSYALEYCMANGVNYVISD